MHVRLPDENKGYLLTYNPAHSLIAHCSLLIHTLTYLLTNSNIAQQTQ